jgi:hypothetical protein
MKDPRMPDQHPEELLASFVDGSASGEERRAVEAHLAGCATCRADVRLATRGLEAMRSLPPVEVPGLATDIEWLPRGRPEAVPRPRPAPSRLRRRASLAWQRVAWGAGIAAAASVAAVFLVSSLTGGSSRTAATGPKAAGPGREAFAGVETATDYDQASLNALAVRVAREQGARADLGSPGGLPLASPAPAVGEAAGPSSQAVDQATRDRALRCLQRGAGLPDTVEAAYLEIASFDGRPAFIGAFGTEPTAGGATRLLVIAVDRIDCQPLYLLSLPLR